MRRLVAGTSAAVALRRLRSRFGIAAPRVAVRTQVAWYWRAAAAVLALASALALAGWIYDAGRRFAGFDRNESESEISALRLRVAELEAETLRLGALANAGESHLQIERSTREQLARQVTTLEEENVRLKENLAVFENLASGGMKNEGISLSRLRVEPQGTGGRYRYRVLASRQGLQANQDFTGELQFYLTVQQPGGESAMMILPRPGESDGPRFLVAFRNFRTLEGNFQLPPDLKIRRVEVRLVQGGQIKASQNTAL
jgi:hypothetical protein